ncbi:MAG: FAD-binding oxidoreductase [Salibacteraceae bacterium]
MSQFHALTIQSLEREPANTTVIQFEIPEGLASDFHFLPGQYLTLSVEVNGQEERRSYSLCSNPYAEQGHRVAVKVVAGGKVSTYLNQQVQVGDTIDVKVPEGRFVPEIQPNRAVTYGLWAGGSGITPILSILEAALSQEAQSRVVLVYANSTPEEVIFKNRLQHLQQQYGNRLKIANIYSQNGGKDALHAGRIDVAKAEELLRTYIGTGPDREHYICGPEGMMKAVMNALQNQQVPANQVNSEYFAAPEEVQEPAETAEEDSSEVWAGLAEGEGSHVTVELDGDEYTIVVQGDQKILDVALNEGIDAPYSCRGGVCASCIAKLEAGEVEMKMNFVLSDDEVEEGLIVTCHAHPKTSNVRLSFDDV